MFYDKKVRYLNYMVDNKRMKGAGFVKAEVRDKVCRMQIYVSGLRLGYKLEKEIIVHAGDREGSIGNILLSEGKGDSGELILDAGNLGNTRIAYEELEHITIPIDAGRMIRCVWKTEPQKKSNLREECGNSVAEETAKETEAEEIVNETVKDIVSEPDQNKNEIHAAQITDDEYETDNSSPYEDKWLQLARLYEHGNVIGDMCDCLIIRPGDFVILPSRYYKLVSNSFLLHGYHNYGYLLLAKVGKRSEPKYYIGVPGNFFQKEKQVAMMFGFEGFECGREEIMPGDFGYYMIGVEL